MKKETEKAFAEVRNKMAEGGGVTAVDIDNLEAALDATPATEKAILDIRKNGGKVTAADFSALEKAAGITPPPPPKPEARTEAQTKTEADEKAAAEVTASGKRTTPVPVVTTAGTTHGKP